MFWRKVLLIIFILILIEFYFFGLNSFFSFNLIVIWWAKIWTWIRAWTSTILFFVINWFFTFKSIFTSMSSPVSTTLQSSIESAKIVVITIMSSRSNFLGFLNLICQNFRNHLNINVFWESTANEFWRYNDLRMKIWFLSQKIKLSLNHLINCGRKFLQLFLILLNIKWKMQFVWLIFSHTSYSIIAFLHLFVYHFFRLLYNLSLLCFLVQKLTHHTFIIEFFK